ncbi:hypothetical protein Egran_00451, partial [Elaphomyces granulatus]
MESLKT